MLRTAKRYPSQEMIEVADELNRDIDSKLITLEEFTEHWYCTYQELAALANVSLSTVKEWHSSRRLLPNFEAKYRLSRIHKAWMKLRELSR